MDPSPAASPPPAKAKTQRSQGNGSTRSRANGHANGHAKGNEPLDSGFRVTPLLAAIAVASLALHFPSYFPSWAVPASLAPPGPVPRAAPHSGQFPPKRYGAEDDGLLGDVFDGEHDYVCDTSYTGVRLVSRDPLVVVIEGFLRKGEPEWIVDKAKPLLSRSPVVDVDNEPREKRNADSEYRTSSSAFLSRGGDAILRCIERRAASFSGVPIANTEALQVVHYQPGQYYKPHYDYFPREYASMQDQLKHGGQRVATFFGYLNTVKLPPDVVTAYPPYVAPRDATSAQKPALVGAGSTQFPNAGVEVFPKKGSAAFWWDVTVDGEDDPKTLHAGTPPIEGEKWGLNIWQREEPFH